MIVHTLSTFDLSLGSMGHGVGGPGATPRHIPGARDVCVCMCVCVCVCGLVGNKREINDRERERERERERTSYERERKRGTRTGGGRDAKGKIDLPGGMNC